MVPLLFSLAIQYGLEWSQGGGMDIFGGTQLRPTEFWI